MSHRENVCALSWRVEGDREDWLQARLTAERAECAQSFTLRCKTQAITHAVWRLGEVCELEVYIREVCYMETHGSLARRMGEGRRMAPEGWAGGSRLTQDHDKPSKRRG